MKLPQTTGFVNQAGGEVSLAADDPENQVLAAMCVIRHARNIDEAYMLHEMLGLGGPEDEAQVMHLTVEALR